MVARTYFSHENPEGLHSYERIKAAGYLTAPCDCSWSYWVGENIARYQKTPEEVMDDWMHSPAHRENIMHPRYTEIGIGIYKDHWVQHFGDIEP